MANENPIELPTQDHCGDNGDDDGDVDDGFEMKNSSDCTTTIIRECNREPVNEDRTESYPITFPILNYVLCAGAKSGQKTSSKIAIFPHVYFVHAADEVKLFAGAFYPLLSLHFECIQMSLAFSSRCTAHGHIS